MPPPIFVGKVLILNELDGGGEKDHLHTFIQHIPSRWNFDGSQRKKIFIHILLVLCIIFIVIAIISPSCDYNRHTFVILSLIPDNDLWVFSFGFFFFFCWGACNTKHIHTIKSLGAEYGIMVLLYVMFVLIS